MSNWSAELQEELRSLATMRDQLLHFKHGCYCHGGQVIRSMFPAIVSPTAFFRCSPITLILIYQGNTDFESHLENMEYVNVRQITRVLLL
mmetsp:Transcript_16062/g.43468  ORF Transcript_16062/g.43468 Transcript_16062/m.43468 type:complete len:90 (+) Transcript_16062:596-865(+)